MNVLINIDVDNLGEAATFYCKAFELSVGRPLGPDVTELVGASSTIYLLARPEGSSPSSRTTTQTRNYLRHWTPIHLDFVVSDIEIASQNALSAGATLEKPIETFRWGRLALMADPFGHGFCLVQFLGKGYDEITAN